MGIAGCIALSAVNQHRHFLTSLAHAMTKPRALADVTIDGQVLMNATTLEHEFGRFDATKPTDRIVNHRLNGRKTYKVIAEGVTYTGKAKSMEWNPMITDVDRSNVEIYPVTIETIDEWPNPCACCGASHDTLDCD